MSSIFFDGVDNLIGQRSLSKECLLATNSKGAFLQITARWKDEDAKASSPTMPASVLVLMATSGRRLLKKDMCHHHIAMTATGSERDQCEIRVFGRSPYFNIPTTSHIQPGQRLP